MSTKGKSPCGKNVSWEKKRREMSFQSQMEGAKWSGSFHDCQCIRYRRTDLGRLFTLVFNLNQYTTVYLLYLLKMWFIQMLGSLDSNSALHNVTVYCKIHFREKCLLHYISQYFETTDESVLINTVVLRVQFSKSIMRFLSSLSFPSQTGLLLVSGWTLNCWNITMYATAFWMFKALCLLGNQLVFVDALIWLPNVPVFCMSIYLSVPDFHNWTLYFRLFRDSPSDHQDHQRSWLTACKASRLSAEANWNTTLIDSWWGSVGW